MRFEGTVNKRRFGAGSKSERDAVVLSTPDGDFVLRRPEGNAFSDPVLEALAGKHIQAEGVRHGYTILMQDWKES
jgi:hypothetical protein